MDIVITIDFSPDGKLLASGSVDKYFIIYRYLKIKNNFFFFFIQKGDNLGCS